MSWPDLIASISPVLLLIVCMTWKHPLPSAKALPLGALLTYLLALFWFQIPVTKTHAAVIAGALTAWTPILIVWGAILFFQIMEHSKAMDIIRSWLNSLSNNRVAQVVLIAWSFQFLVEGASGFGTPAALAAPLLVGLGFPALQVAATCLIFNTIPVSFGAVGTPVWFGFGQLNLSSDELRLIAIKTSLIHAGAACLVPLLALRLLFSWQEIRQNIRFIALSLAASVIPMTLLSALSSEFPSVIGGLIGLGTTAWLAKRRYGLSDEHSDSPSEVFQVPIWRALLPFALTITILLVTRIPLFGLRTFLNANEPSWTISLGNLGELSVSRSLVIKLKDILATNIEWSHPILYIPSIVPFALVGLLSVWFLPSKKGCLGKAWQKTLHCMIQPIFALIGALIMVKLMMVGDTQSIVVVIGNGLANLAGQYWQIVAAFLGGLGSFFTGSNTISNLTFGPVQNAIAYDTNLDRTTILALQSVGGAMGNMISILNIVAVASVLGISNQEGRILRKTILPFFFYGLLAALLGTLLPLFGF